MKKLKLAILIGLILSLSALFAACVNDKTDNPDNGETPTITKYKIYFMVDDLNHATVETAGNEMISLPSNPTKTDFIFDGWFFYNEEQLTNTYYLNTALTKNVTVNAKFKSNSGDEKQPTVYTVTFNTQGGSIVTDYTDIESGSKITEPAPPTRDDYIFDGWYKEPTCNSIWNFNNDIIISNTILYAKWTGIATLKYTVTFDSQGGNDVMGYTDVKSGSKIAAPAIPFKANHTFSGWHKESACNNTWDFDNDTVTKNTILYAKWVEEALSDDYVFALTSDYASYEVASYNGNATQTVIPRMYDNLYVTAIRPNAFKDNKTLQLVTIANTIRTIGAAAFENCEALQTITIPDNVQTVGVSAFENCTALQNVTIKNGVLTMGARVFYNCTALSNIQIPDSILSIGAMGFRYCTDLSSVKLSENMTAISNSLFAGCTNLDTIVIPNKIIEIGESSFSDCTKLESITICGDDLTTINDAVFYNCTRINEIYINLKKQWTNFISDNCIFYDAGISGNGITVTIGKDIATFPKTLFIPDDSSNLPKITKIIFEENSRYATVNDDDFFDMPYLTEIILPDSITEITRSTLKNTPWYQNQPNGVVYAGNFLIGLKGTEQTITVSENTILIAEAAFENCLMTSLTIPFVGANRTATGAKALFGYIFGTTSYSGATETQQYYSKDLSATYFIPSVLANIILTNADKIPYGAFYNCTMLNNISLNEGLEYINDYAFWGSQIDNSITIPDTVIYIGEYITSDWSDSLVIVESNNIVAGTVYCEKINEVGILIELTATTNDGYSFLGWYDENDIMLSTSLNFSVITIKKSLLYIAKWEYTLFSITYYLYDGVNGDNPATYTIAEDTIVLKDASKKGYNFAGWYEDSNLIHQITTIQQGGNGNKELHAKYSFIEYSITYDLGGGTNENNPQSYNIESNILLSSANKIGYTFLGWYLDSTFKNKIQIIESGSCGDLIIYASWRLWDGGQGIENDPYIISNSKLLKDFAALSISGNNYSELYFILTANIDLDGVEWTPIKNFSGHFNGNDFIISNFKITISTMYVGIFGINSGAITDLGINNFFINVSYTPTIYVGGLVGYNFDGHITNCYVKGNITSLSTSSDCYSYIGGLAGCNSGNISNCFTEINIDSTANANATYSVDSTGVIKGKIYHSHSTDYVGGIVGYNSGNVYTSYVTGVVNSTALISVMSASHMSYSADSYAGGLVGYNLGADNLITNSYATATVSATGLSNTYGSTTAHAGALVGYMNSGRIVKCYANGNTAANASSLTRNANYSCAGGLVGFNSGIVSRSYATGNMSAITSADNNDSINNGAYVGGLIGYDKNGTMNDAYRYEEQIYNRKIASTNATTPSNTIGIPCAANDLNLKVFYIATLEWDSDIWDFDDLDFEQGKYPTLKVFEDN